jgi:hypothetical protein
VLEVVEGLVEVDGGGGGRCIAQLEHKQSALAEDAGAEKRTNRPVTPHIFTRRLVACDSGRASVGRWVAAGALPAAGWEGISGWEGQGLGEYSIGMGCEDARYYCMNKRSRSASLSPRGPGPFPTIFFLRDGRSHRTITRACRHHCQVACIIHKPS